MEASERKWTDYTDEEKLLVIDGYLDGVVALDDENENLNKQRLEWIRAHIPAYKVKDGKNYIFVSYSHLDYKEVYKDLAAFSYNSQRRVRFWYDEGLPIGQDWEKAAGELIKNPHCVGVLFYLSKNLLLSPSVFKEIEYVKGLGKPYCTVALNDELYSATQIFKKLAFSFSEAEAIFKFKTKLEEFFPDNNTALISYGKHNVLSRIEKIADVFDVTEEVFSDFVCEECGGGLRLVAYRGNNTTVRIPEKINGKDIVEIAANFPYAVEVCIPMTVTLIGRRIFDSAGNLEKITVDKDNPIFFDINGVLCERNRTWEYWDGNGVNSIVKEKQGNAIVRAPIKWDWKKQFIDYNTIERLKDNNGLYSQLSDIIEEKEGPIKERLKNKQGYPEASEKLNDVAFQASVMSLYDDGYEDAYWEVFEDLFSFAICYLKNYAGLDVTDFGYAIIYKKINIIYNFIKKLKCFSVFKDIKFIEEAFVDCKNLDYLFLHDNIEEIDSGTFEDSNIRLVFLPDALKTIIFGGAFRGCKNLQSVLTETNYYETHEDDTLDKALFFGKLEKIVCNIEDAKIASAEFKKDIILSNCSFIKCSWLRKITLPKISSLYNAFSHCLRLRKVILEEGTEQITSCCFNDCISLKYIKIPKSVKHIDSDCFWGCDNLEVVEYGGTIKEWLAIKDSVSEYDADDKPWVGVKIVCSDGVIEPSHEV